MIKKIFSLNKLQVYAISFMTILFTLFMLLGYNFQCDGIEGGLNIQKLSFFDVFFNNSKIAFLNIVLGCITFSLYGVYTLFLNGVIAGSVIKALATINLRKAIITGIIPHGIFEIPAIIISSAISLIFYIGLFRTFRKFENKSEFFRLFFKKYIINLIILDFILLLVAAIIESTISFA
ncbi:stage II sporulation protein M [Hathewaya histolytica]|uniref:stage II sporulation protein M n=1 Tax=Hathewaya histolytica TaxID=1498 RepID=UPI003B685569